MESASNILVNFFVRYAYIEPLFINIILAVVLCYIQLYIYSPKVEKSTEL